MKLLYAVTIVALLLVGLGMAPPVLAQDPPEHPVMAVICRPLPPAGGADVAKVLADRLQDLNACPAGQFPMRYGSGKDLPNTEACVAFAGDLTVEYRWPIRDVEVASTLAIDLAKVQPCPPNTVWRRADPDDETEHGAAPPWMKRPPSSYNTQRPIGYGVIERPAEVVEPSPSDLCPLTKSNSTTDTKSYRCYANSVQNFPNSTFGVSGIFTVEKPFVPAIEQGHSIGQFAIITTANAPKDALDTVEMGWRVSGQIADHSPHLFVFFSINDYHYGAYNFNGGYFRPNNSSPYQANMVLNVGQKYIFQAFHVNGIKAGWHLYVNGIDIGYYSDALWLGTFTQATQISWYGEVAANTATPTTAMGSGRFGSDRGSASISGMNYYDVNGDEHAATSSTGVSPSGVLYYATGSVTSNSFTYGGPGWGSLSAYVPNFSTLAPDPTINLIQVGEGGLDFNPTRMTVSTGASESVANGGRDAGAAIAAGGLIDIGSGGSLSGALVSSGGIALIEIGGTESGSTILGTEFLGYSASYANYSAGTNQIGSSISATVEDGGLQVILSGGLSSDAVVAGGGTQAVSYGGLAEDTTVSAGGTEIVSAMGVIVGTTVYGSVVVSGGTASGLTVMSGGADLVLSGGIVSGTVVSSGGIEELSAEATVLNTIVESGGIERFEGGGLLYPSDLTLEQDGMLDFASIAFGSGTSLNYSSSGDGGTLSVTSGNGSFSIALFGQYAAAGFELSSDGDGGTLVTYGSATEGSALVSASPPSHQVSRPPDLVSPPSQRVNFV